MRAGEAGFTEASVQSREVLTGLTGAVVETQRGTSWIRSAFRYIVLTRVQHCNRHDGPFQFFWPIFKRLTLR